MKIENCDVKLYFDPVSDICVGALTPTGEQLWLAGAASIHTEGGLYRMPFITCVACGEDSTYEFQHYPLGLSAAELQKYARRTTRV